MAERGYTMTQVATASGCTRQNIRELMEGRVPGPTVADRLAQVLDDPQLLQMVLAARRIRCVVCNRTVIAQTFRRRYCSATCNNVARTLGRRAPTETEQALLWERNGLAVAVEAMCRSCEPEGICRTQECPLRAVSPLPYSEHTTLTIPPRSTGWSVQRKRDNGKRMTELWARDRERRTAAITAGIRRKRAA